MITRFAPSPTGPLHLGHAYAAIFAHDRARAAGGQFLLRIEDLDPQRSRPVWEQGIVDDLAWLGLTWDGPVWRQSERGAAYAAALQRLWQMEVIYPCTCTRADIAAALAAPQGPGGVLGPDGLVYPGTCRTRPRPAELPAQGPALRLNMGRAMAMAGPLTWQEKNQTQTASADQMVGKVGDVVLARRGMGSAYHLAVTVDDAAQGVTLVTRGEDLIGATPIHVLLQVLLEYQTPRYWHHDLIRDANGKRLAKRDDARALSLYRAEGVSPQDIRRRLGL